VVKPPAAPALSSITCNGNLTVPVIGKLNGFSMLSLDVMITLPLYVPAAEVINPTVNVV
jgi:hypothetical protein